MAMSDQEMATEITKAACALLVDKSPLATAADVGNAVATIYTIVFEVVKTSGDA